MLDDGAIITLFRFGSFEKAKLTNVPGAKEIRGNPPPPDRLDRARWHARYPFGLREEQLASLLETRGQEELVIR
jgi:hypothetical protein